MKCKTCGYRIRGENHESGSHHRSTKKTNEAKRLKRHGVKTNVGDPGNNPKKF